MKKIWIIGIGKFGRQALNCLERVYPDSHFVLIDFSHKRLAGVSGPDRTPVHSDGVTFLVENLHSDKDPDWIIPAVPIHLVSQWILTKKAVDGWRRSRIPEAVMKFLPNCIEGKTGDMYVSHADFICPDNCPEPADSCFFTGKKRKENMFDLLSKIKVPGFHPVVVRSYQLVPGVGGYQPKQLFRALREISTIGNAILLSTACRCHGVITGLKSKKS